MYLLQKLGWTACPPHPLCGSKPHLVLLSLFKGREVHLYVSQAILHLGGNLEKTGNAVQIRKVNSQHSLYLIRHRYCPTLLTVSILFLIM